MRIRTIKPEFWQDEDLSGVSDKARLLAIGLLNLSDDEGYFKSHPRLIQSAIFPFCPRIKINTLLEELRSIGYIALCTGTDSKEYGLIVKFVIHQRVNRPTESHIKDLCNFMESSVSPHGVLTPGKEGKGRERKGKGFTPPSLQDVKDYIQEKDYQGSVDPERFIAFYSSKGWKVGTNSMKCWRSAVTGWHVRYKNEHPGWRPLEDKPTPAQEAEHKKRFDDLVEKYAKTMDLGAARIKAHEELRRKS